MSTSIHSKPVIGILGGIGAGKSTVAREFAKLDCRVIDGDAIGHELLAEPDVGRELRGRWGAEIFRADGGVDRAALAARVFGRPLELAEFNTKYEYCMKRFRHLLKNISVKVLADPAPAIELDVALSPPREMTAEEAEAVLEKLAPHRLKKKPGPKIDHPAVAA